MVLIVALTSVGLVFQIFDTFTQWFQSRLQSQYAALARLISYIAASAYRLYLLATGKSVVWFAIATSVDHIAEALFLLYAYRRNNGPALSCSVSKAKQLLSASSGFIVSGLMVSVYAATDKLMLKHMLDETAVGYYGVAVSISTAWVFVLQAVIDSIQPSIIQAYERWPDRFRKRNRQLYALVFYSATGISLMICLLAKPIILLLFGESYRPAIDPLRIVVWYSAFSYLGVARNAWIVCEHKQKYLKYLNLSAAVINVALNLIMIPLWGPSGAALASLLTQIATSILLPAMIKPLRTNVRLILEAVLLKDVFPEKK